MRILLALILATGIAVAQPRLTADTNRTTISTFAIGEPIQLVFTAKGLDANAETTLELQFEDEHKAVLDTRTVRVVADADGNWTGTVDAPRRRLGFYRVRAELADGTTIAQTGSRPAGYLTYAVVPDPATRPLYPSRETFFGMQGGFGRDTNIMPYLGIRWILGGLMWKQVEPDRPGQIADQIAAAKKKGEPWPPSNGRNAHFFRNGQEEPWKTYRIFAGLYWVPMTWQTDTHYVKEKTKTGRTVLTAEGETHWADFVRGFATAVAESEADWDEHLYELAWEPVPPWGWAGTAEDLIRYYEIAYPIIHEVDPKACVTGPCAAGMHPGRDFDWLEQLFSKGLAKYMDAFSTHPYIKFPPERHGLRTSLAAVDDLLRRYGHADWDRIGTEQGGNTEGKEENELLHARGCIRENLILLGEGWRFNLSFYIVDYVNGGNYGYYYNLLPNIPWGPNVTGPKPAAPAYAAMSWLLEGHHPTMPIEWLGDTALGYAYERPDSNILALWDFGGQPNTVTIPVGVDSVEVYDWMGNGARLTCDDGMLTLTLTPDPVYVRGVSPQLWGSGAERPVQLAEARLPAFPGTTVRVAGTVKASLGQAVDGVLLCRTAADWPEPEQTRAIRLDAGAAADFAFSVTIPATAEPGTAPFTLVLRQDRRAVAATGGVFEIRPPVAVDRLAPTVADGVPAITVTMREQQQQAGNGTIRVRLPGVPGGRGEAPFALEPGATAAITIPLPEASLNPVRSYPLELTVTTAAGYSVTTETELAFFPATRLAMPQIDADLGDWQGVPVHAIQGRDWVVRSDVYYDGTDDSKARLRYAWTPEALLLAWEVEDDVVMQPYTGWDTWKGDCLQLGFDLDPFAVTTASGNDLLDRGSRRYTEIDLALTDNGPEAYRTATYDTENLKTGPLTADRLSLAARRDGKVTVYEAAIPWATLGATQPPEPGSYVGISATVNDRDTAEQHDVSALGIFQLKEPSHFGQLYLAPGK